MRSEAEINAMFDKAVDRFEECDPSDPRRLCQAMAMRTLNWVLGGDREPIVAKLELEAANATD